jgi:CRISPR/Cas system-associated exonuclease Cas4 (RecB family)
LSLNISASLLKDFGVCQKRAYYRLYEPSESVASEDGVVGSSVHRLIELFWNSKSCAFADIEHAFWNEETSVVASKVKPLIEAYFELFPEFFFNNEDVVEQYFKIPYKTGVYLTGRMDRVTTEGIIYDWKTSKKLPRDINTDPQFLLYYLAFKLYYKEAPRGVAYVSLPHKKVIWFKPIRNIIDNFEAKTIPECISVIQSKSFKRNGLNKPKACAYCQFKEICWKEGSVS